MDLNKCVLCAAPRRAVPRLLWQPHAAIIERQCRRGCRARVLHTHTHTPSGDCELAACVPARRGASHTGSWPTRLARSLVTFLDGLSTQAALLAGFAFAGLATVEPGTHVFWKLILYVPTVCTLGCMLFVVCVGQLATLLAPTLALNGPTGSINRAVVGVRLERRRIFAVFTAGLVFFFIEIVGMVAMTVEDVWLAWLCEIIMVSFFAAIAHYSVKQTKAFAFEVSRCFGPRCESACVRVCGRVWCDDDSSECALACEAAVRS